MALKPNRNNFFDTMSPKIHPSFWSDPDLENTPANTKLIFLWLITNPRTEALGTGIVSPRRFEFETGLDFSEFERALPALTKPLWISGQQYFIRHYIRYQFGSGNKLICNNIFKSLVKILDGIRNGELVKEVLTYYPEFVSKIDPSKEALPLFEQAQREREGERERESVQVGGTGGRGLERDFNLESRQALSHLNKQAGRNFRETPANLNLIVSRLKESEVTLVGVKLMIERQVLRWKDDEKMFEYLRPETLFRASKFDSYYSARELPIKKAQNSDAKQGRPEGLKAKSL